MMGVDKLLAERAIQGDEGCTRIRDVPKDATLTYDDVTLPPGRLLDQLLEAQRPLDVGIPPGLIANV